MLFLWGVVLHQAPDLFDTNAAFAGLKQMARQSTWELGCLVVGGGRLVILGLNGTVRRSPHLRAIAAFITTFFWVQIAIGIMMSGVGSTGLAVYPILALLDTYNVIRASREAGALDAYHKRAAGHVEPDS
jgi:hypothetical protein